MISPFCRMIIMGYMLARGFYLFFGAYPLNKPIEG
jgi:hypothetical protein